MIGFRSKTPWKIIIALIYYSLCFLGFEYGAVIGVASLMFFAATPVVICSVYNALKTKNLNLLYSLPVYFLAVGISFVLITFSVNNTKTVTTETPVVTEEIPADTKPESANEADLEQMVYITRSGDSYHKSDCRIIKNKESISISINDAITDGKIPCSICN